MEPGPDAVLGRRSHPAAESTWRALPPLPTPRHGLGVVSVGTALYALAGGPRPGLTVSAATEALDLAPLGRCTSTG